MSDLSVISSNKLQTQRPELAAASEDDAIDLSQIIDFTLRHWRTLATTVALALLCGAALFVYLPNQWSASVTVEIGRAPFGASMLGITPDAMKNMTRIEQPEQAVARLKQRELIEIALASLGTSTSQPDQRQANLFRRTLKPTLVKNTNFIQIGVSGYSPDQARSSATAIAQALITTHNKMVGPEIQRITLRLKDVTAQLTSADTERARLKKMVDDAVRQGSKIELASRLIVVTELANVERQVSQLRAEQMTLEDLSTPPRSYPTQIVDSVYVES
ncbi:MAG TPA: hypothetical protein VL051_16415, partial [Burkholderiaceae bacterium]|nr:hypothetical protein [Burkholderiaceae bacterium]